MFRFTIRDLLWLTVVVALGVGWGLQSTNCQSELGKSLAEGTQWRHCTGALERVLHNEGWSVTWNLDDSVVIVRRGAGPIDVYAIDTNRHEPSNFTADQ